MANQASAPFFQSSRWSFVTEIQRIAAEVGAMLYSSKTVSLDVREEWCLSGNESSVNAPLLVVRVAGLPAAPLKALLSLSCLPMVEEGRRIREELAQLQSQLARDLERFMPQSDHHGRRFLLKIKRDAFNGRGIAKYSAQPDWKLVKDASPELANRLLNLEGRLAKFNARASTLFDEEKSRERRCLAELVRDTRFMRGIALKSPDLVRRARTLASSSQSSPGRRERKVEQSLLRYLTRSSAKLSPYSTLTVVALGRVVSGFHPSSNHFQFREAVVQEESLVRAHRAVLDQCLVFLLSHPLVRAKSFVALNDTLLGAGPDYYRFYRNSRWELDPEKECLRFTPGSFMKIGLSGPLVDCLERHLNKGGMVYASLVETLASDPAMPRENKSIEEICYALDRLINVGFLSLLPPWESNDIHVERRILKFLRELPLDPPLERAREVLERLLLGESLYPQAAVPEDAADGLRSALMDLASHVESLSSEEFYGAIKGPFPFFEDVTQLPSAAVEDGAEVLDVSASLVVQLMKEAELVSRFIEIFNYRHDFLHALAVFWADRWPDRSELGFVEFLSEASSLWKSFLRFESAKRYSEFGVFAPFDLPSNYTLANLRSSAMQEVQNLMQDSADGKRLPFASFKAFLDAIPFRYRPILRPCIFTQPADAQGEAWVLNRLFEGTGRYFSRYTAGMNGVAKESLLAQLTSGSNLNVEGEEAFLLDMMYPLGSMVNFHVPQTQRVLELPGSRVNATEEQRVRLSDVRIVVNLEAESFQLRGPRGHRLIPVHLTTMNSVLLPPVLRFMSVFGPYEARQFFPRPRLEVVEERTTSPRLLLERLVLQRKRWSIDPSTINGLCSGPYDFASFAHVQDWRDKMGLPIEVFMYEQMHGERDAVQSYKPQYLNFQSPLMVQLFLALAAKVTSRLIIEEALPVPAEYPNSGKGPRAFELQIDSLTLGNLMFDRGAASSTV